MAEAITKSLFLHKYFSDLLPKIYNLLSFSKFLKILLLILIPLSGFSEQHFTLSGYLRDSKSGEALIGASIYLKDSNNGTFTNEYGFFSLSLPKGTYHLIISYIGYQPREENLVLEKDIQQNFSLTPRNIELEEITVKSGSENSARERELGSLHLNVKELNQIPVLFGEQDILKSIQLLPGIVPASEGNSSFHVRGGNTDQNLILLDDAPVFNPSHLLGFFSVFNSDAIRDLKLYKGDVPARYGGRASSVMDIRMNEGNLKEYHVSGGLGLISSRLMIEGPIAEDKASFMISGRRTYADLFLPLSSDENIKNNKLYFYDLNFKSNVILNRNNHLFLSGYLGRDVLKSNDFGFNWGNRTGSIRWNHQFSPSLFSNTTFVTNDYDYRTEGDIGGEFTLKAGIKDISLKQDYTLSLFNDFKLLFGFNSIFHHFTPGEVTSSTLNNFKVPDKQALENALYIFSEKKISSRLNLGIGLRYSLFSLYGPGAEKYYDSDGMLVKNDSFPSNRLYRNYSGLEPRINLTWMLSEQSSVKVGFNRMSQYIHLLSNYTSGTPVDYWLPCSNNIKPQNVNQYSAGYFRELKQKGLEFSLEAYYKEMSNQIDYKNNANVFLNEDSESELLFGKGRAYGIEFLARKTAGAFTGWVSYTLSRSEKKFEGVNNFNWYPARQDRTHDISVIVNYQVNRKLSFSTAWVYYTGNAITVPNGKYYIDNNIISCYDQRNNARMPAYHRLDLGANLVLRKSERFTSELTFGLYNAYARKNAYLINFRTNEDNPNVTEAVKLYLFTAIPSITWNFKF